MARWSAERWAASSGMVFAIVLVVSNFLAGTPPHYNASSSKIASFLADHHKALVASSALGGLLVVLFLWFLASFAGMYREAGQRRLSTIMYGGGVAAIVLAAVGDSFGIAVTQLYSGSWIDARTASALYGTSIFFYIRLFWPLAALAAATVLATHRSKLLPEWYTWLTAVGCVLFVLGGLSLKGHGFFSAAGAMPWIGFIALAVWAFVSSALCVQKHASTHTMAPAMSH